MARTGPLIDLGLCSQAQRPILVCLIHTGLEYFSELVTFARRTGVSVHSAVRVQLSFIHHRLGSGCSRGQSRDDRNDVERNYVGQITHWNR